MSTRNALIGCLLGLFAAGGCGKEADSRSSSSTGSAADTLPPGLFASAAPESPRTVTEIKSSAQPGEVVVVRGRIGGSESPFVDGRAVFTLADMAIPLCGEEKPDDHCQTPWDYCCEPRERLLASTVTVQAVAADGKPLRTSLNGAGGLKPGAEVMVRGRVSQRQGDAVLVIDAESLFVRG